MSLGRGLGALISTPPPVPPASPKPVSEPPPAGTRVLDIPLSLLHANPEQPRQHFDPVALEELAASLKEHGVLEPLLVNETKNGTYEIIAGERRFRAAKLAGLTTVPALVKNVAHDQKLAIAIIENVQRQDLNPIEEAFAYQRLIDEFDLTQEQIAKKVGKSRPVIANTLRLLALPKPIQAALIEKTISMSQARTLLALKTETEQLDMLASLLGKKITVRELEREVSKGKPTPAANPAIRYLEDELRAKLGAKVRINAQGGIGTITVSFFSDEELGDLVKKIVE